MSTPVTEYALITFSFSKKLILQSSDDIKYATSRKKEFGGLMERNVFTPAK